MLDSSKIESLKSLQLKIKCQINKKCLISAAIIVSNQDDLCFSIGKLREIASGGNIAISLAIRRVFRFKLSNSLVPS